MEDSQYPNTPSHSPSYSDTCIPNASRMSVVPRATRIITSHPPVFDLQIQSNLHPMSLGLVIPIHRGITFSCTTKTPYMSLICIRKCMVHRNIPEYESLPKQSRSTNPRATIPDDTHLAVLDSRDIAFIANYHV